MLFLNANSDDAIKLARETSEPRCFLQFFGKVRELVGEIKYAFWFCWGLSPWEIKSLAITWTGQAWKFKRSASKDLQTTCRSNLISSGAPHHDYSIFLDWLKSQLCCGYVAFQEKETKIICPQILLLVEFFPPNIIQNI